MRINASTEKTVFCIVRNVAFTVISLLIKLNFEAISPIPNGSPS